MAKEKYTIHNGEEHEKAKKIAEQVKSARDDKRKMELFHKFYAMIDGHHTAEEKVVFPYLMERVETDEDRDLINEMIEEHHLGMYQFSVVNKTFLENETWDPKFNVLFEVLEHHMDEEVEELMPLAKKILSEEEDIELCEKFEEVMKKAKQERMDYLKK